MKKKSFRILISILLLSIAGGLVCDFLYNSSPNHEINLKSFNKQLTQKEEHATSTLNNLKSIIIHTSLDSLIHYPFTNEDITYYVFQNGELAFWSDNQLDVNNNQLKQLNNWKYLQLTNAHCVGSSIAFDDIKIIALIIVKYKYPYENNELTNAYATGFKLDKNIQIISGNKTDSLAVTSATNYLFSFAKPKTPIFKEIWANIGLFLFTISFCILFILYAGYPGLFNRKTIKLKSYLIIASAVGVFIGLGLFFNIPSLVFYNNIFSPLQYASNPFLASISHLTIVTGYLIATIYLFYLHVDTTEIKSKLFRLTIHLVFLLYFILLYYILSGLIYHSSIQLNILQFDDFSTITLWIHFLLLLLGVGLTLLFVKTRQWLKINPALKSAIILDLSLTVLLGIICYFVSTKDTTQIVISFLILLSALYIPFIFSKFKNIYGYIAILALIYTAFLVVNSKLINENKLFEKYKVLAQNISTNGNIENDRMADILLEELDIQISNDPLIGQFAGKTDSLNIANNYLNTNYLRGFWNKYDMRINVAKKSTELHNVYAMFVKNVGKKIKKTHFYSVPSNENNMAYIGVFPTNRFINDSLTFYMEFYPRRNFKSYSFPNLLISSTPDIQSQLNIAIAKYEHQKLVYSSGHVDYVNNSSWIINQKSDFFKQTYNNQTNYIYSPNKNTFIVITQKQNNDPNAFLLYFIYVFIAFSSLGSLIVWSFLYFSKKKSFRLGLTAKFQYAFISLMLISFLGIFYVSVNFIQKKYQDEQITNLENKKNYIQKALQDMYYWNQDLNTQNSQSLNFDLQDLSYIYHTDIHVYDNQGMLIGSSQPLIFNKGLISNRISPQPYFTNNSNINQYEYIGKLKYLTGYTDFYNGDFLQIGYIAVPQFFSQNEIRNEIESFLTVIIHIYLIIIILAILLSLFIGKQLSAPLNILENKLKEMRLGRRNEKIEYKLNDEIGQLVTQYNLMVDELEQSAKLLAQSERETAWKSMARQVAHEINNPLTPMKLSIQQLQRTKSMNDDRFDDYFTRATSMLIEQIDNLSRIAGTFSNFARMPEANFERVDIAKRLHSVFQLFSNNFEKIEIQYHGPEKEIFVYADPEQLVQVFNNLLKNAIQSIPATKKGMIKVSLKELSEKIQIEISDNGMGIKDEIRNKLFDPNFTTKTNGMGLGLAISKNIIELSGGSISFDSTLNTGTIFTILLNKEDMQHLR